MLSPWQAKSAMIWFQPKVKVFTIVDRSEEVRLAESPCPMALIDVAPTLLGKVASKNGLIFGDRTHSANSKSPGR